MASSNDYSWGESFEGNLSAHFINDNENGSEAKDSFELIDEEQLARCLNSSSNWSHGSWRSKRSTSRNPVGNFDLTVLVCMMFDFKVSLTIDKFKFYDLYVL